MFLLRGTAVEEIEWVLWERCFLGMRSRDIMCFVGIEESGTIEWERCLGSVY